MNAPRRGLGERDAQLSRGVLGPCILALLTQGPRYGLQLVRELEAVGGLLTSQGTIYPLLDRLEQSHFVNSSLRADGGQPKRFYKLSADGEAELERFRKQWQTFNQSVSTLLATGTQKDEGDKR